MIYHDILGVPENATVSDINRAYEQKAATLEQSRVLLSQQQYDKKSYELLAAKESCLSWHDKNFAVKTTEKVQRYSSEFFSRGRVNEVCIGPCTCCDVCGGPLCTCNSSNDSFLVACCGCKSPWFAILCDVLLYAILGIAVLVAYSNDKKENEKKLAQELHAKMIADTERELSSLNKQLDDAKRTAEAWEEKYTMAESELQQITRFAAFYTVLGSTYMFNSMIDVQRNKVEAVNKEKTRADIQQMEISKRRTVLSARLQQ